MTARKYAIYFSESEAEDIIEETLSISDDMYKLQRSGTGESDHTGHVAFALWTEADHFITRSN